MSCGKMLHVKKPCGLSLSSVSAGVKRGGDEDPEKCEHGKQCQGEQKEGCVRESNRKAGRASTH